MAGDSRVAGALTLGLHLVPDKREFIFVLGMATNLNFNISFIPYLITYTDFVYTLLDVSIGLSMFILNYELVKHFFIYIFLRFPGLVLGSLT